MNIRFSWRQIAGIASLIVAILVNLPLLRLTYQSRWIAMPGMPDVSLSFSRMVFHFIFTFCFTELNRYVLTTKTYRPRLGIFGWYVLNFIAFLIVTAIFIAIILLIYPDRPILIIVTTYFRTFFVWVTALLIANFLTVLQHNRTILAENELLKQQSLQAQLDTLRAQLNPHFLFNSLNALSSLIREGGPKSQEYLAKLSQVLRYSLQVHQQSLVPFAEEMQFTTAYSYLVSIRFGKNLRIENQLPAKAPWQIPPMSLQLLIENAVKHNIVSNSRPLTIYLMVDPSNEHIIVRNVYQPKIEAVEGTGSGLANLDSRFRLLTHKPIQIMRSDTDFSVHLPIIPLL